MRDNYRDNHFGGIEEHIFCWNDDFRLDDRRYVCDESLRDGLQDPDVIEPSLDKKLQFVEGLNALGVAKVCLGFPASSKKSFEDTLEICKVINEKGLSIKPYCAARTVIGDIEAVARVQSLANVQLGVTTFIGVSPIRRLVEKWDEAFIFEQSMSSVSYALEQGLDVNFVMEDTTRCRPDFLKPLVESVHRLGCKKFTLCDTVGQSLPSGVASLVSFVRSLDGFGPGEVILEWHGHNDRGFGLSNAFAAWQAGCDGVHGTLLGIGERAGNSPLELLLLQQIMDSRKTEVARELVPFVKRFAPYFGKRIESDHPLIGDSVFVTASGVHASAVNKSLALADKKLADRIYSSVPASLFGLEQEIKINHTSGRANVQYWMSKNNIEADPEMCEHVLSYAKTQKHTLTNEEIYQVLKPKQAVLKELTHDPE
jgi:2-isopropylmalate synthase